MDSKKEYIKILFRFGDNDFRDTFLRVFLDIQELWENSYDGHLKLKDKEQICKIINILAWPKYQVFQLDEKYREERFSSLKEEEESYRKYFLATPDRIYLNKEVDIFLKANGSQANSEWFVYDSTIYDPIQRVYSI